MVDVTNFRGKTGGLTDQQRDRLKVLEASAGITDQQRGEAAYLATQAVGDERDRALRISNRKRK